MKAHRQTVIKPTGPPVRQSELVQLLVQHITGGDPAAYLDRLAEKEADEKAALAQANRKENLHGQKI